MKFCSREKPRVIDSVLMCGMPREHLRYSGKCKSDQRLGIFLRMGEKNVVL